MSVAGAVAAITAAIASHRAQEGHDDEAPALFVLLLLAGIALLLIGLIFWMGGGT